MRSVWRRAAAGVLAIGLAVVLAAGAVVPSSASAVSASGRSGVALAAGDVDDFRFRSLDVDYVLSRADDGTSRLRVVERFVAEFPDSDQNHGMRRGIPDRYNGQPLRPRLVSITDGAGQSREEETDTDDGTFWMTSRAPGYVHGEQVYVFTYELENVTWYFPRTGTEELYWNVLGADWAQPFGAVTATVHVDPALVPSLTGAQACYAGSVGSTAACPISADGGVVTATATDLAPNQAMTIAVGFAPGTFVPFDASYLASGWAWLQLAGVALLLVAVGWAIAVRRRRLRDDPGRPVVIAEYTPPAIDALSSAVFLATSAKAIPAEVLEQAVAGSIRIEEGEAGWFGRTKLVAVLVDPARADEDGRMLLEGLFGKRAAPGASFTFGSTDRRLSAAARALLSWAGRHLKELGLYRTVPWTVRTPPALALLAGAFADGLGGILALRASVDPLVPVLLLIAIVPLVLVVIAVLAHRPLTRAGAELRDHLAGLRVFIEWAEADRIRMLQSPEGAERVPVDTADAGTMLRIYEPLLPYAVVFGQEKQWAERLAVLYGDSGSPGWYAGSAGFNAAAFSAGIGSLSAVSSASSSTSGGSTGGGSAGGGGGGGGGGGV
ncbi:DUF2207 domain-containing protein [Microbacterium sp. SORGH_AS_0888]|uniref:DUF2207 domain-containing protein n=1 Tax=Microbacterium sp. SORGH_AS_0888 TaxID=3041791 RepID=UPI00277EE1D1|nr:DUF2207 domain-containing protein [Microbacterium sp. SORGH_AS_0888]MDQ1130525.1 hypothetical protein [Microbacterium sp. SORGH_AS_0888]